VELNGEVIRRLLAVSILTAVTAGCSDSVGESAESVPTGSTVVESAGDGGIGASGTIDSTVPADPSATSSLTPSLAPASSVAPPIIDNPAGTATFAFTGDTLMHSPLWDQARRNATGGAEYDFAPLFERVRPYLSAADWAVCHLETPFAPVGRPLRTQDERGIFYQVPREVADGLAATGFDRCSTASNHTMDGGTASIDTTVAELERVGISQAGMARVPTEIEPTVVDVNGLKVAHLSYTYGLNDLPVPPGEPWRTALIDVGRIVDDARRSREMGAEAVIVSMHWGSEGSSSPNDRQRAWARQLAESGLVDLVVGSHPHVLQPIELIGETWILHSLGNFISNMPNGDRWPASTQDGAIVFVTMSSDGAGGVEVGRPFVRPTWVNKGDDWVVHDLLSELSLGPLPAVMEESMRRTTRTLGEFMVP